MILLFVAAVAAVFVHVDVADIVDAAVVVAAVVDIVACCL